MRRLLLATALFLALPALAQDDISKVNAGITLEPGREARDLETVNGGIRVGEASIARDVETVNGGIELARGAKAESVSTVNGSIELSPGAEAGGGVSNVNGGIEVTGARIGGRIETVNGGITLDQGAKVIGGIKVEKPTGWSWGKSKPPRIVIGRDVEVGGELVFEREVELWVHASAKIGAVTGAQAKRYDGATPPN